MNILNSISRKFKQTILVILLYTPERPKPYKYSIKEDDFDNSTHTFNVTHKKKRLTFYYDPRHTSVSRYGYLAIYKIDDPLPIDSLKLQRRNT